MDTDSKKNDNVSSLSVPKQQSASYKPNTTLKNWKSQNYIAGVASDAETEAIDNLYGKFKEISNQKGLIQTTINDLDKEYLFEQEILNKSFNSMISL
eukprot:123849_1